MDLAASYLFTVDPGGGILSLMARGFCTFVNYEYRKHTKGTRGNRRVVFSDPMTQERAVFQIVTFDVPG